MRGDILGRQAFYYSDFLTNYPNNTRLRRYFLYPFPCNDSCLLWDQFDFELKFGNTTEQNNFNIFSPNSSIVP